MRNEWLSIKTNSFKLSHRKEFVAFSFLSVIRLLITFREKFSQLHTSGHSGSNDTGLESALPPGAESITGQPNT
jgi:hypothetical protein